MNEIISKLGGSIQKEFTINKADDYDSLKKKYDETEKELTQFKSKLRTGGSSQ